MNNSDDLISILDLLLNPRPLAECCGKVPANHRDRGYCAYCEMTADWCQCDASDICRCEEKK